MQLLWRNSEEEIMKISLASQIIYSPNQSIDQVEEEMYHLVGENRSLKKSLALVREFHSGNFTPE